MPIGRACGVHDPAPIADLNFRRPNETNTIRRPPAKGILSGEVEDTEYDVQDVAYSVHAKRDAPTMHRERCGSTIGSGLIIGKANGFALNTPGFARHKAIAWWKQRSPDPFPDSAQRAVEIAEAGGVAYPIEDHRSIVAGEKYDRIVACQLGEMPEPVDLDESDIVRRKRGAVLKQHLAV